MTLHEDKVPDEWKKAIIVPLHKSNDGKDECNNYTGTSLLTVPGKSVLERQMDVTE